MGDRYDISVDMGDCKCGRMPRVAPLSEETAQDTIKILEDFSKSLETELKALKLMNLICEDIEKSIKSNDMKEKNTKKMTKAEAFEYLKGTKVFCKDYDKMEAVQDFVRSLGFCWGDAGKEMVLTHTLFLFEDGGLGFALSLQYFRKNEAPELSADDILSIEIVEEKKEKFVDCSEPCDEIKAVQELLRNSKHLKDKTLVITKDNAAIL